jgi:iron complex outermembrane receptor protein
MPALVAITGTVHADDRAWLEEVIVTARKVPEQAGTVPLVIDILGADTLAATGVNGLQQVSALSPGLGFEAQFGASGGQPMLRGQSQPTAAGDNVALFVDGVYQANREALDVESLDLERIELIRGPQSALFGHSAFAGALNYVSRAPTRELSRGFSFEGGSDAWLGAQAFLSGRLGGGNWLGRIAASYREANGALEDASSGEELGGFRSRAVAASLARDAADADDWTAVLAFRYGASDATHPAVSTLDGTDYNCGSQDLSNGVQWSYYCGRAPVAHRYDLSEGLPESTSRHQQLSLRLSVPVGSVVLESDSSWYDGRADTFRDLDASAAGQLFGVCVLGRSCPGPGIAGAPVERFVTVNQVDVAQTRAEEWSQEFRLLGGDERFGWLLGAVWFETTLSFAAKVGADRGDLASGELLTALLPATPGTVGEISVLNFALTDDSASVQVEEIRDWSRRRTLAGYVALDWRPAADLAVRAELRHTDERFQVQGITAGFLPNTDPTPPEQRFQDNTPRLSVAYAWNEDLFTWLSAARGSRSGGINPIPGLNPSEQSFAPEYNWTWEAGLRFATGGVLRDAQLVGYYIDWRDTQILMIATTPGHPDFITGNTAGVTTRGIEASIALQPAEWLRAEFDFSHVDPRFRAGSDAPGVSDFCGLTPNNSESTACTLGPPRTPSPNNPELVPWIDDNVLARVPRTSWHAALVLKPPMDVAGWQLSLRTDLSHQDDMYENQIEGLRFGERTLLDARLSAARGAWAVELWGSNLTDDRYIRSAYERFPSIFPTSPRPIDFICGDGRRFGITVRYAD